MQSVSADHAIELAHTILRELNLGAVRRLCDSLNGIAKKQLNLPEMIPQDREIGVKSKYLTFAPRELVHFNGFSSPSMVGINSVTVG
jgi:hypothetical protein